MAGPITLKGILGRLLAAHAVSLILSITIPSVSSDKILFLLPLSTKSHKIYFEPLINALAERDHEVQVFTNEKSSNLHSSVVELLPITIDEFMMGYPDQFETRRQRNRMSFPLQFILDGCHRVIQNETFQRVMMSPDDKFDLIIIDGFLAHCLDGFVYKSEVPFIMMTSMPAPSYISESTGNFLPPSLVPVLSFREYEKPDGHMGFWQRLKNFVHFVLARMYINLVILPTLEKVYKQYLGDDIPGIIEIEKKAIMVFMNSHFSMNFPRPLLPAVIEIGGIHCQNAKPLDPDLEKFVSKSETDGFIFFSVGSLISLNNAPEEFTRVILSVFSKLQVRVLLKWKEMNQTIPVPENILIRDWFPQQDILGITKFVKDFEGHENIRLFITHGGLLSLQEAVYHKVPVLGIPFGIDQDTNIHHAVLQGYALKLDVEFLTEESFSSAIYTILDNSSFQTNVQRISKAFHQRPVSPLETAVFWTEYVTTMHKENNLLIQSPARNMSVLEYYSCDVVILIVVVFAITVSILKKALVKVTKAIIEKRKESRIQQIHKNK